jgi:thiol-disulfide isomerase/thioredoxin
MANIENEREGLGARVLPTEGLALFMKRDCPTCQSIAPVAQELARCGRPVAVFSQDDPTFPPEGVRVTDDRDLRASFLADIEFVPTLVRYAQGREVGRAAGWVRDEWRALAGVPTLGANCGEYAPGCGSKTHEPGVHEHLQARYGSTPLAARRIEYGGYDDDIELCYERGWSDGLPVVPPTDVRVMRMLGGTRRRPDEVIGNIPPNLAPCTVEKVAINAVMAGCRPEYMPVVLAAIEAALEPVFTLHGVLATTYFSAPIVIVNGPVAQRIGMNCGINALGQGNRANATICRALNLVVRNVGGGRPGEVDRSTLGAPSKIGLCFAEDESDPDWQPLSVARGFAPGVSTVTLVQGHGPEAFVDQKSRAPDELARSFGMALCNLGHPKLVQSARAVVVLSPEHHAIFRAGGWDRQRITQAMMEATRRPGGDLVVGAHGVGEGVAANRRDETIPKFFEGGLELVRAGGPAGLFSAILPGWLAGRNRDELQFVTRAIGD